MHPEADALLGAIFDHPDEDTPRLVYADWLQEHGQENHAQFIRLQCAAAREKPWSDEANRLWVEIGRVWYRLLDEWWPATHDEWPHLGCLLDAIHFERGFLRPERCLTDFQLESYSESDSCWSCVALPGCTLLLTPYANWQRLASRPLLRRIRSLRLATPGDTDVDWESDWLPGELAVLLKSERLCNLRKLDLSVRTMTQQVANTLLSAPHLSTVEKLVVSFAHGHGPIPDETVRALQDRFKDVVWAHDWDSE